MGNDGRCGNSEVWGVMSNGGGSHSDGCWDIIAVWWMIIVSCRDDCGRW